MSITASKGFKGMTPRGHDSRGSQSSSEEDSGDSVESVHSLADLDDHKNVLYDNSGLKLSLVDTLKRHLTTPVKYRLHEHIQGAFDILQEIHGQIQFFREKSYHDIFTLCKAFTIREFPPNTSIYSQGSSGDQMFIILRGKVGVFVNSGTDLKSTRRRWTKLRCSTERATSEDSSQLVDSKLTKARSFYDAVQLARTHLDHQRVQQHKMKATDSMRLDENQRKSLSRVFQSVRISPKQNDHENEESSRNFNGSMTSLPSFREKQQWVQDTFQMNKSYSVKWGTTSFHRKESGTTVVAEQAPATLEKISQLDWGFEFGEYAIQAQCNYENSRCEPTVCLALSWSDAQMLISMEQNNDSNDKISHGTSDLLSFLQSYTNIGKFTTPSRLIRFCFSVSKIRINRHIPIVDEGETSQVIYLLLKGTVRIEFRGIKARQAQIEDVVDDTQRTGSDSYPKKRRKANSKTPYNVLHEPGVKLLLGDIDTSWETLRFNTLKVNQKGVSVASPVVTTAYPDIVGPRDAVERIARGNNAEPPRNPHITHFLQHVPIRLGIVQPGQFVGGMSIFLNEPSEFRLVADTDCELLEVHKSSLDMLGVAAREKIFDEVISSLEYNTLQLYKLLQYRESHVAGIQQSALEKVSGIKLYPKETFLPKKHNKMDKIRGTHTEYLHHQYIREHPNSRCPLRLTYRPPEWLAEHPHLGEFNNGIPTAIATIDSTYRDEYNQAYVSEPRRRMISPKLLPGKLVDLDTLTLSSKGYPYNVFKRASSKKNSGLPATKREVSDTPDDGDCDNGSQLEEISSATSFAVEARHPHFSENKLSEDGLLSLRGKNGQIRLQAYSPFKRKMDPNLSYDKTALFSGKSYPSRTYENLSHCENNHWSPFKPYSKVAFEAERNRKLEHAKKLTKQKLHKRDLGEEKLQSIQRRASNTVFQMSSALPSPQKKSHSTQTDTYASRYQRTEKVLRETEKLCKRIKPATNYNPEIPKSDHYLSDLALKHGSTKLERRALKWYGVDISGSST